MAEPAEGDLIPKLLRKGARLGLEAQKVDLANPWSIIENCHADPLAK
ncbi:hypothetical protein [Methylorubrum sp. SB2]